MSLRHDIAADLSSAAQEIDGESVLSDPLHYADWLIASGYGKVGPALTREQAEKILDLASEARHTARTAALAMVNVHSDLQAAHHASDKAWEEVIRYVNSLTLEQP